MKHKSLLFNVLSFLSVLFLFAGIAPEARANGNVHVSRFWHNHQPIYWPEWMGDGSEPDRGQLAWDSIQKKPYQNYGGLSPRNNPENDLEQIFGLDDRKNSYQGGPSSSLGTFSGGGFAMSYSGSLIDNVRQLGSGGRLGYGGGWNSGNTFRRQEGRLDLLGFTFHHSLAPLLPKEVFRKELQIFKQAWWKAWAGNADGSDHSKGFFPTEMGYTRDLIDVLVDEGYEWVIVASHHISRTSPSYNDRANPEGSYNIYSSPPNRADQLGPRFDNPSQWWYGMPNPGNAAWNVAPFAYHLHKVQYVNPETGAIKEMVAVPSDDVLSYRFGYANEGIGKIVDHIAPHATDPNRPVIVMPSTDGDNAWGGGSSSWMEATPQFFNASASAGYVKNMPGHFVNAHKQHAPVTHIEDGAWIFPESCYGSPNFLKWIEPPLVNPGIGATNRYPGTQADMETPGYALKFFSYAPLMAGANWVITAEQILRDQGGEVRPWVVHAPYGVVGGEFGDRNDVELAWHIYLKGLDSGFNYYGGLGNDDEVKPSLATKRAVDKLRSFMSTRMDEDRTPPTALKPQRFPYNPGAYTFGWFNRIPGGDERYLKKMPSEFYIWTHAYDVSGVQTVNLKIRRDKDGVRSLQNTHNETYAGGSDVEEWVTIPMTKRVLPNTRATLNTAANNGEIDFFVYDAAFQPTTGIELADYYFARIDEGSLPGFRGNLFDYYIETTDTRGNTSKSEIQHVWVADDGNGGPPPASVSFGADPRDCAPLTVTYTARSGLLSNSIPVVMWSRFATSGGFTSNTMTHAGGGTSTYTFATVPDNAPVLEVYFQNAAGTLTDNRGGANYSTPIRDCDAPQGPVWTTPTPPVAGQPVTINYNPAGRPLASASSVNIHYGYNGGNWTAVPGMPMTQSGSYWTYTYTIPAAATSIVMVFNQGGTTWDNNGGQDFKFNVESGGPQPIPSSVSFSADPRDCAPISVTYVANDGVLSNTTPVTIRSRFATGGAFASAVMTHQGGGTSTYTFATVPDNAPELQVYFTDAGGTLVDNLGGAYYRALIRDCDAPAGPVWTQPVTPVAGESVTIYYNPTGRGLPGTSDINIHYGYNGGNWTAAPGVPMTQEGLHWRYTYTIPSAATSIVMAFNHRGQVPWDNNGGQDFVFAVQGGTPPPTGFVILTPTGNTTVALSTTNFILSGIAQGVTGSIAWTNSLTGLSGLFPVASPWTLPVALDVGANVITLTGTNAGAAVVTNALDSAANYTSPTWTNGANAGTGFGAWSFDHAQGSGFAGVFVGNPTNAGITGFGESAFGFYANPTNSGANAEVSRSFSSPMPIGAIFRFVLGLNWDSNSEDSNRGFNLMAGDTELININMGNSQVITINGDPMFAEYGAQAMTLHFEYVASGSIRVWGTGRNGAESYDQTLVVPAGAPSGLKMYFNATDSAADERQMYFNNLAITSAGGGSGSSTSATVTITREAAGGGDTNGDGIPDSWYAKYGIDPSIPGLATQLTVGGHVTYWEEFVYDTDPTNAASFNPNRIVFDAGDGAMSLFVQFPTSTGRWYDVWWSTSLMHGAWTPMNFNRPGNADQSPVLFHVTNDVPVRYYRTGAKLPGQ